ncbi:MAG: hypothetical protein ACYCXW_08785 [Solirubrobacteraceae bacterium]
MASAPEQHWAGANGSLLARSVTALFEREDPATLQQAVTIVCPDRRPSSDLFDAIADVWGRYRHIRELPWD